MGCGPVPGPPAQQTSLHLLAGSSSTGGCDQAREEDAALCMVAVRAADRSVLLMSSNGADPGLRDRLVAARGAVGANQLLLVATTAEAAQLAQSLGIGWYRPAASPEGGDGAVKVGTVARTLALQWRTASRLLLMGCTVVVSAARVTWHRSPFPHLARDVDVEVAQLPGGGDSPSRGAVVGVQDPPMGWSAYGQTMTCPLLDPSVVASQPTRAAAELAASLAHHLEGRGHRLHGNGGLAGLLTRLVHQPAHDGETRSGVTMRVLRSRCFTSTASVWSSVRGVVSTVATADAAANEEMALAGGAREREDHGAFGMGSNEILTSADSHEARALVLSHGCQARPPEPGAAAPRPLNDILKPTDTFPDPKACALDENMQALCGLLRVAAIEREVLACVSNKNIFAMLSTFLVGVARANISNAVVVALDDPTAAFARSKGAHTYVRKLVARGGSTDNHATSGLKFAVIYEFLSAGCSVLLSDVDVLWVQNPFTLPSLYRDSDVEGMTDGWDDPTAYGYHWHSGGGGQHLRLSARNSGLFYARATVETRRMMARLKGRMLREAVWDQTAYNEEMWWATLPGEPAFGVSARVMNYYCHLNSKIVFRYMLQDEPLMQAHRPVSIHVNYHPEKLPRMEDAFERYHGLGPDLGNGIGMSTKRAKAGGLYAWHWGVGLKAGKACRDASRSRDVRGSDLAERIRKAGGALKWAGIKGLRFRDGGMLETPWGPGQWGVLRGCGPACGPNADQLFADFIGQQHVVTLHKDGWPKLNSLRCADFENVTLVVDE
jgi:hypothetical protein